MEQMTKRILAIVLIAVIGTGIGVGAWFFLAAPGVYSWSADDCPGAPADINSSQIIRIGVSGDIGEIQGDAAWEGAYLAAKEINTAGGILINGSTYYVGITSEDTDEVNPNLVTARGVAAAERLVFNKRVQFATGAFRSEALLAYRDVFMDNKIPFINTGAATDEFCQDVRDNYAQYKYFFRINPINSTSLAGQVLTYLAMQMIQLNATYPNHDVVNVGILAEDLTWTAPYIGAFTVGLPAYGQILSGGLFNISIVHTILYDITLDPTDMASHLTALETAGCDIVVPVISAQGGIMMMTQYDALQPDYLIIGIDVQAQLDTFWADSGGACKYETLLQIGYNTTKTAKSIPFWNAYVAEWGHEPLYIASGSYDAINTFVWAINESQSFLPDTIVAKMEEITQSNYLVGAGGQIAFWPNTHEIVAGYPFGYALFCQWQPDGTKNVIPSFDLVYPDAIISTGNYTMAPWVHTAWS